MSRYMDVEYNDPTVDREGNPVRQSTNEFRVKDEYLESVIDQISNLDDPIQQSIRTQQVQGINKLDSMVLEAMGNELTAEEIEDFSVERKVTEEGSVKSITRERGKSILSSNRSLWSDAESGKHYTSLSIGPQGFQIGGKTREISEDKFNRLHSLMTKRFGSNWDKAINLEEDVDEKPMSLTGEDIGQINNMNGELYANKLSGAPGFPLTEFQAASYDPQDPDDIQRHQGSSDPIHWDDSTERDPRDIGNKLIDMKENLSDLIPENEKWDLNLLKGEIGLNLPKGGRVGYRFNPIDSQHKLNWSKKF